MIIESKVMSQKMKVAEQYSKLSKRYDDWFSTQWPEPAILQGQALDEIFKEYGMSSKLRILDLTCGIGTQSIGLAMQGHEIVGLDISQGQLDKAKKEADKIGPDLDIMWVLGDAACPQNYVEGPFDVIISFENSMPLLGSEEEVLKCFQASYDLMKEGGLLLISMRDHSELRKKKPYLIDSGTMNNGERKGVWVETGEWLEDGKRYLSHIIFVISEPAHEQVHYPFPPLIALTKGETLDLLKKAGFHEPFMKDDGSFICPAFYGVKD